MKGQKETSRTYCPSMVSIGNAPKSRHLHLVNCFQEGMLELIVQWGSVSADFRPFHTDVGEGEGKEEKYEIDRKSKSE